MFLLKHLNYSHWSAIASVAQFPALPATIMCPLRTHDPLSQLVPRMNAETKPILLAQGDHAGGCQPQSMAPQSMSFFFKTRGCLKTGFTRFIRRFIIKLGVGPSQFSSIIPAWLNLHSAPNAPIQIIGWWKSPAKTWAGHFFLWYLST